jgi:hypothetical protein
MKRLQVLAALAAVVIVPSTGARLWADEQTDMRAVVEKAIKAHGGADELAKDQAGTVKMTGKFYGLGEGIPFTLTVYYQHPDKVRTDTEVEVMGQKFTVLQIINGDKGWISVNGMVMEFNKDQIEAAKAQRHESEVTRLLPLRDKAYKLSPLGEVKVEGKPAIGVRVEREGRGDVNLFFDKETNRLIKIESRGRDPMAPDQEFTQETYLSDYRKRDNVLMPHKMSMKRDGKLFVEAETTEATSTSKLDESLFAKP